MLTVPAVRAGTLTIIWLSLLLMIVAELLPKVTREAVVNPLPLIVTVLPPATGPEVGVMSVIVGIAA